MCYFYAFFRQAVKNRQSILKQRSGQWMDWGRKEKI
nr:MAG TPA: Rubisco accumulation factor 1 helix turn helix domain [Caudoviricetes sp.]